MAKKEITEYQPAEDTSTVIQCDSCDKEWNSRGVRGSDGVNTVILNAAVQRKRYSGWNDESERKWNGTSLHSSYPIRFTGDAVNDYCKDCWNGLFTHNPMVEVEKPEYYVDEVTKEQYYCDFCDDDMGEEPEHIVSLNPYLTIEKRVRQVGGPYRREESTATRIPDDRISCSSSSSVYAKRFDSFDCCDDCANDIFNLGRVASTKSVESFTKAFAKGFKSVFFGV
jgi:hypothetical protein